MKQLSENIRCLNRYEKMRYEKHANERIVTEYTPIDFYDRLNPTIQKRYENLVITKNRKIPKLIKTIGKWKKIGGLIQFVALIQFVLLVLALSVYKETLLDTPRANWNSGLYTAYILFLVIGPIVTLIVGGLVRIIGRKQFAEYIEVWNPLKAPMEIVRLNDGRIAILNYLDRSMQAANYSRAIDANGEPLKTHTVLDEGKYLDSSILKYCYVIDKVISVDETNDGLVLESSGKYYGLRVAISQYNSHRTTGKAREYYLWSECDVNYRKEIIPTIFEDMELLLGELKK